MKYTKMKRLYILLLTILCVVAVSAQTKTESPGIFRENNSGVASQSGGSNNDSNSGIFRVGSTENTGDGGGATKESEAPLDSGNGILLASFLFAAFYMYVKIRKEKKVYN